MFLNVLKKIKRLKLELLLQPTKFTILQIIKFSKRQIRSLVKLTKILIKKYKIRRVNILGHSDTAPLRKKDPGEKFPWKNLSKKKIGIWHNLNDRACKKLRGVKLNNENHWIQLKKFSYLYYQFYGFYCFLKFYFLNY